MGFSLYKHGISTTNATLVGDVAQAINTNFSNIGDNFDSVLNNHGAWSSATTYAVNDVVSLSGTFYVAVAASTNHTPPNVTYWTPLGGSTSGLLAAANNLSDLASASTARTNLGLGSAATTASSAYDASGAAATVQSNLTTGLSLKLSVASNLSDLANATTARTNLGFLNSSTQISIGSATFAHTASFNSNTAFNGPIVVNGSTNSLSFTDVTNQIVFSTGGFIGDDGTGNVFIPSLNVAGIESSGGGTFQTLSLPSDGSGFFLGEGGTVYMGGGTINMHYGDGSGGGNINMDGGTLSFTNGGIDTGGGILIGDVFHNNDGNGMVIDNGGNIDLSTCQLISALNMNDNDIEMSGGNINMSGGSILNGSAISNGLGSVEISSLNCVNQAQISAGLQFSAASNLILDTSTGTKIGTATSQKFGLWNATPIVQPTTSVAAATFTANSGTAVNDASTFDGYTLKQIVKALRTIGALA